MTSLEAIQAAIPHRPPMLLVDQIVQWHEFQIVCRKQFRTDEFFFQGHYPNVAIVPGVILCEAAMQAGAILLSRQLSQEQGVPVVTRMNNVKFKRVVRAPETIDIHVTLVESLGGAFFLKAQVTTAGQVAVRFEFACTLAPLDSIPHAADGVPESSSPG